MKDKNVRILIIFSTLTLLITMIGATFAYFTAVQSDKSTTPLKVYTYSQDLTNMTASNVSLHVRQYNMNKEDGSNEYLKSHKSNEPGEITITTNVGSLGGTNTCVYDLIYVPHPENGPYMRSAANNLGLKELVLEISAESLDANTTITKGEFREVDITDKTSTVILVKDATLEVEGVLATGQVKWEIYPKIYNLAVDQSDNAKKIFGGSVTVTNLDCDNE